MLYNKSYDYWVDEDYDARPIVPRSVHKNAGEALHSVLEQLYDSANSIDKDRLRQDFAYLCGELGVEDELLLDPNGLCVEHYREKYLREEKQDNRYKSTIAKIGENAKVLREQLCGEEELDKQKVERALAIVCFESNVSMHHLEEVRVKREKKRSEIFEFASSLVQLKTM